MEWTLLASLARLGRPDGTSAYLRLSTRPVDQALAAVPTDTAARERRRRHVVAGGYLLRRAGTGPAVTIAAMGATVPEALAAADRLAALGHATDVVCVTSPGLLFDAVAARGGRGDGESWIIDAAFPDRRAAHLGVTRFGQSGDLDSVYRYHGLDADSVVAAALDVM